jgi:hypothetical protein
MKYLSLYLQAGTLACQLLLTQQSQDKAMTLTEAEDVEVTDE